MKKQNGITLIALIITIIVMLILVGVTVNVALNGGLFDTAKQAVSEMNMAQIEERAYMIKAALIMDMETNKDDAIVVKQQFKTDLCNELGGTIQGDKVILPGEKYDIIVKNTDLDIEVVEHSDYIDKNSIITQTYNVEAKKPEGIEKTVEAKVNITINTEMDSNTFTNEINLQLNKKNQNTTLDEKEKEAVEYLVDSNAIFSGATTLDEAVMKALGNYWGDKGYDNLEDWTEDSDVIDFATVAGITELKVDHLYAYVLFESTTPIKKEDVITSLYMQVLEKESSELRRAYNKATGQLGLKVKKDGVDYNPSASSAVAVADEEIESYASGTSRSFSFDIYENGTYEVSIMTASYQSGFVAEELLSEKIIVNNIESLSDISGAISREEAKDVWSFETPGVATYIGKDETVSTYPTYIGTTKVDSISFRNNKSIKKVILPETVTSIKSGAFAGCTNLTELTIPNSVTTIGTRAFEGCENLTELTIPSSVTSIEEKAFYRFTGLEKITIPDSVKTIGLGAFEECTSLTNVIIEEGVTSIETSSFNGCTALTQITIPNSVKTIRINAFKGCTSLDNVKIPSSVTSIESEAFAGCTNLKNITIEEGVSSIGQYAFKDCTALESITLPNSVTVMYKSVVVDSGSSMTAPTYENRSNDAFVGCTNLTNIYFAAGSNDIPTFKPWGAPNENVTVTKSTE